MPGLFGGIVSVLVPFMYEGTGVSASNQMNGLILTLCVSVSSGWATGKYLLTPDDGSCEPFSDSSFWVCSDDGQHKGQDSQGQGESTAINATVTSTSAPTRQLLSSSGSHSELAGRIDSVEGALSAHMGRVEARMVGLEQSVSRQMQSLEAKLQGVTGSQHGPAILEQLNRIEAKVRIAGGNGRTEVPQLNLPGPIPLLEEVLSQLKRLEGMLATQNGAPAADGDVQTQLSRIESTLAVVQSRLPNQSRNVSTASLNALTQSGGSGNAASVPATLPTAMSPSRSTGIIRTMMPQAVPSSPYLPSRII